MKDHCPVCRGTQRVEAHEHPTRGWECEGLCGPARCNRPSSVSRPRFVEGLGEVRTGKSPCPLCISREIVKTETDEFGYSEMDEMALGIFPIKNEEGSPQ